MSDLNTPEQAAEWANFHRRRVTSGFPKWPNEAMLKLLFGSYLAEPRRPQPDWRVLDVGCGFGNNLVPFADLGCECHGVEIDQGIVAVAEGVLKTRGYSVRVTAGSNRSIPYPESSFDLLLSVNTIHYEGASANIHAALAEYRRVLKPGGTLYLSTVGPAHEIQRRARPLGEHRYRIENFDFRDGQEFFFFDTEEYLEEICRDTFAHVETGQVTEKLMTLPLDFLIAVCR